MINKKLLIALLALFSLGLNAQVGLNCQFVPGIQLGAVTVKSENSKIGEYKAAAGLPVFMLDRLKNHWYAQLDMNGLYYSVTQSNKSNRSDTSKNSKMAKTEGGLCAGRIGYGFGKGESMRVGPNLNVGYMMSNLNRNVRSFDGMPMYWNFGAGIFYYQKIGTKIRAMAKLGFEKYSNKKTESITNLKGSGMYFEATAAYNIYQKYGVAVMPAFYSKKFTYNYNGEATETKTKVKSIVLRIGFTKFF